MYSKQNDQFVVTFAIFHRFYGEIFNFVANIVFRSNKELISVNKHVVSNTFIFYETLLVLNRKYLYSDLHKYT